MGAVMPGPPPGFVIDAQPAKTAAGAPPAGFMTDESKDAVRDRERKWADVPAEAASNLGGSALKFGENLVQPVIHPIDTVTNLKNLALGLAEYAGGVKDGSHKKYADAVGQMIADRYGSMDNLKRTLATDPVGVLADFSGVATGGGALLRGAGAAARVAGATRTGERLGAAGRAFSDIGSEADPLRVARNVGTAAKETVAPSSRRAAVNELTGAGNLMTPGQRVGGVVKYVEDKAAALPLIKDLITHGRNMSIDSMNKIIGQRTLQPISEKIKDGVEAGHELVKDVHGKIDAAYDRLLPNLTFTAGARLQATVRRLMNELPPPSRGDFQSILTTYLQQQRYPMPGPKFKVLESKLGDLANNLVKTGDAYQKETGKALSKLVTAARGALVRQNPRYGPQLQKINTAWAMYKRMEDAAGRRVGSSGVFTTSDLLQASRNAAYRGPWARGDAIFQRFAEAAHKVLPRHEPESGTPGGSAVAGAIGAGLAAAGGTAAAKAATAAQLLGAAKAGLATAPLALAYTRPGMHAVDKLARHRRDVAGIRAPLVQAGRIPDEEQVNKRQPLRFTVPPSRPGEVLAPPQDGLSP